MSRSVLKLKTKLCGFSPEANYTDWATATGRRILVPTPVHRGVSRGQRRELLFLSGSSSFIITRLTGPHSGPNCIQKIW
jgi:hypothetical protein